MSLLAIDIGSSSCKAVALTVAGEILAHYTCGYTPDFPEPAFAEMNPCKFWDAVCCCTRAVSRELSEPVRALCLSSHGETVVPLDARGEPLAPAILNLDSRATAEAAWIEEAIGRRRLFEITGLIAHPMYPVPKLLWLRGHQPDLFSAANRFVTVIGYLLVRMGFPPYADYSLASRFLAFDVMKRCWSEELVNLVGLKSECLPVPVPTGTIAGKLNSSAASELGIPANTLVVIGGHDQPCGALGLGIVGPRRVADSIGTYECIVSASDAPILNDQAFSASLNSYCHVVPDKYVTLAYFPSGIMVKWFYDLLFANPAGSAVHTAEGSDDHSYSELEASAPVGPTGLCIAPHLIGTCNPDFNPKIRGTITGLTPSTQRGHIYKGILEGLACELAELTAILSNAVGDFQDIYVTGGGSRSTLGLRLRAALTGRRLHLMKCPEAVCLGSAMLAGVAAGEYSDLRQAVDAVVIEAAVLEPDPATAAAYREQVTQYRRLRSALAQIY